VLHGTAEYEALHRLGSAMGFTCITKEKTTTYGVDVRENSFDQYLASLGSNTRLKLFNRRKNLSALGDVRIRNVWPDQEYFYQLLNTFHEKRWGKPCYRGRNLSFMRELLNNLVAQGQHVDLSVMTLNDEPVSVILDIAFNGRIYNLQTGYLENFANKISLGTLHFGYQLEAAFAAPEIDFYDFMAGSGKNADYKTHLANKTGEFHSLLLVKSPLLKMMYWTQALIEKYRA
jgi:hypothetical protein